MVVDVAAAAGSVAVLGTTTPVVIPLSIVNTKLSSVKWFGVLMAAFRGTDTSAISMSG